MKNTMNSKKWNTSKWNSSFYKNKRNENLSVYVT